MTSHQFHDCDGFLLVYRGVQCDFADSGSHIFGCASKAGGVIGPDQVIVYGLGNSDKTDIASDSIRVTR